MEVTNYSTGNENDPLRCLRQQRCSIRWEDLSLRRLWYEQRRPHVRRRSGCGEPHYRSGRRQRGADPSAPAVPESGHHQLGQREPPADEVRRTPNRSICLFCFTSFTICLFHGVYPSFRVRLRPGTVFLYRVPRTRSGGRGGERRVSNILTGGRRNDGYTLVFCWTCAAKSCTMGAEIYKRERTNDHDIHLCTGQ